MSEDRQKFEHSGGKNTKDGSEGRGSGVQESAAVYQSVQHIDTNPSLDSRALFRDVDELWCPLMVEIPLGRFEMGSSDPLGEPCEYPRHLVTFDRPFAVGCHPVTFEAYDHFVASAGYERPCDEGWGRGQRPVVNVSWNDSQTYLRWLSDVTGQTYRLLSEAEWEFCCRAGTTSIYWWGDEIDSSRANYKASGIEKTVEVGSFPKNPWGLYDMHGNVWEWVEDVWQENYIGAPENGEPWLKELGEQGHRRVVRGGSWNRGPTDLRATSREHCDFSNRVYGRGFRVARDIVGGAWS